MRLNCDGEVQEWSPGCNLILDLALCADDEEVILEEIWGKRGMTRQSFTEMDESPPPPPPPPPPRSTPTPFKPPPTPSPPSPPTSPPTAETQPPSNVIPDADRSPCPTSALQKNYPAGDCKPVPSPVDENCYGTSKEIDIGCPLDAPATIYIVEQNPILSTIVGVNIKLPAFPAIPW